MRIEEIERGGPDNIERFDPFSPRYRENPYPIYQQLRLHDPVHLGVAANTRFPMCWYLTRHEHVSLALKDSRLGVDRNMSAALDRPGPTPHRAFIEMVSKWV